MIYIPTNTYIITIIINEIIYFQINYFLYHEREPKILSVHHVAIVFIFRTVQIPLKTTNYLNNWLVHFPIFCISSHVRWF